MNVPKKEVIKIRIEKEIKICSKIIDFWHTRKAKLFLVFLVLTLLLIFCAALVLAANELTIDTASGYVGIGTSSPGYPLDVSGSINATDYYGSGQHLGDLELADGLVLYMPFQAGQPLKDFSKEQNDGINYGATWNYTGGYNGLGAYEFDGVNDYIQHIADTFDFQGRNEITLSAWFKAPVGTTSFQILNNGLNSYAYFIELDTVGRLSFVMDMGWTTRNVLSTTTNLDDNTWHYGTATVERNSTNTILRVYVDGDLEGTRVIEPRSFSVSNTVFWIGQRQSEYGEGTIDEVMIYNRSLSAEEVKRLYELRNTEPYFDGSPLFLDHNNDRVGIGTSSPTEKLHIQGGNLIINNTPSQSAIQIYRSDANQLRAAIDGYGRAVFGYTSLPGTGLATGTTVYILALGNTFVPLKISGAGSSHTGNLFEVWKDGTTQRFVINASGNVGIGTSSPSHELNVIGTVNATSFIGDGSGLTGVGGGGGTGIWNRSGTNVYLNNSGDSVGIGTSSPLDALHVSGDIRIDGYSNALRFNNGTTQATSFYHDSVNAQIVNAIGQFSINNQANSWINLLTNSQYALRIDNNQNIGIPTVDASYKLKVSGDVNLNDSLYVLNSGNVGIGTAGPSFPLDIHGDDNVVIRALSSDSNSDAGFIMQNDAITWQFLVSGALSDYFLMRNGGNGLTVHTSGWLGINDGSPDTLLSIQHTDATVFSAPSSVSQGYAIRNAASVDNSFSSMTFLNSDATSSLAYGTISAVTPSANRVDFVFSMEDGGTIAERIRFTGAGDVGIGTSNPSHKLTVIGTVNATAFVGDGSGLTGVGGGGGTGIWNRSATNVFLNNSGDSVGIGTSSPGTKLHVDFGTGGQGGIGLGLAGGFGLSATAPFIRVVGGTDAVDEQAAFWLRNENSNADWGFILDTDDKLKLYRDTNVDVTFDSGKVGIGDTSPDYLLDVESTTGTANLEIKGAGTGTADLIIDSPNGYDSSIHFRQSGGAASFVLGLDGSDSDKFKIGTSNLQTNTRLTIDSAGKVGIGTSSPVTSLHVDGKGSFGASIDSGKAIRALNLIDPAGAMRVWRYINDGLSAPTVELIYGTQSTPQSSGNYWWDFYVNPNPALAPAGSFVIRDRTLGANLNRLVIDPSGNVGLGTSSTVAKL